MGRGEEGTRGGGGIRQGEAGVLVLLTLFSFTLAADASPRLDRDYTAALILFPILQLVTSSQTPSSSSLFATLRSPNLSHPSILYSETARPILFLCHTSLGTFLFLFTLVWSTFTSFTNCVRHQIPYILPDYITGVLFLVTFLYC